MIDYGNVKVSVLITTYNQKKYIKEAINSVLSQKTEIPFEVLIGDDASTDGTDGIVRQYEKQFPNKIHAICRSENLGASANFFDLLQLAQGEYIALLEGDDFWTSNQKLEQQVRVLEQNPNISACVHDVLLVDTNSEVIDMQELEWVKSKRYSQLSDFDGIHLPGHVSSVIFRNFLLNNNHDYSIVTERRQVSDRTIFLILYALGSIIKTDEVMSAYRISRNTESQSLTHETYILSEMWLMEEMQMLSAMEQWLESEFKQSKQFSVAKAGVFLAAIFGKSRFKHNQQSKLHALLRTSGHPMRIFMNLPYAFLRKVMIRLQRQQR